MFVSHMLFDKKRCTEMAKSLKVTRTVTLMAFAKTVCWEMAHLGESVHILI